ncbi:Receptor protein kinase [Spatholobus suberectus]|nr:Receptor protein kinase [Spatholobus suberectus]
MEQLSHQPATITKEHKRIVQRERAQFENFTLQELVDATNSFNIKLLIGFGDFGEVYKGTIRPDPEDGVFLFTSFALENKIANYARCCSGLHYLHNEWMFRFSNVLLDWKFHPKLSNFPSSREGPTGDHTGKSIGILTGRSAVDRTLPKGEQRLIEWVKKYPANSSRFSTIMDPRLKNQYSLGAARKIAKLADSCLKMNPQDRQSMSQIVESLKQALQYSETTNTSHNMTS